MFGSRIQRPQLSVSSPRPEGRQSGAAHPSPAPRTEGAYKLKSSARFAGTRVSSPSGLEVQVTDLGAVFAIRHGETLVNQVLPGPAEDGLFRLLLRRRAGSETAWGRLAGAGIAHRRRGPRAMEWNPEPLEGLVARATLALHAGTTAWAWHVSLRNDGPEAAVVDVLLAQDLGLGSAAAVRNSEAFTSQYLDLQPEDDPELGWVILARQNLAMEGGRHPWLATGCVQGAPAYCTDGTQFFGADHRLTRTPLAVRAPHLPSVRLQYECAVAGLQSREVTLAPGATAEVTFVARLLPDHPAASAAVDIAHLRAVLPAGWARRSRARGAGAAPPASLFVSAPWLHGDPVPDHTWTEWFPGERRHEERGADGRLLSFFSGAANHVVSRDKEARLARPHGHILRSGGWRWIDPGQFGTTCYAAGIFSAQAYLGNPTFGRLLGVVRDSLGIGRSSGQRVFVRQGPAWLQLGIPSAFAMGPGDARWIYQLGADTVEARAWCSRDHAAAFLELRVAEGGEPREFLVTHALALDANEFDHGGRVQLDEGAGWAACRPAKETVIGARQPGACFAVAAAEAGPGTLVSGDGPVYGRAESGNEPYVVLQTPPVHRAGVILCGTLDGMGALPAVVAAARGEWARGPAVAAPPAAPVRLSLAGSARAAVARVDEVLPWFVHNAAIHFSAPHGLEQHGGAAWGVRDVCQGSVEWLLAAGEWPLIRRALESVFSQQYARDGSWPQWFMHAPFQSIQHAESHGDVCFWPVKALCDYVEASNDLAFLSWRTGYTSQGDFSLGGPQESLLQHCDRVIAFCESRFVPGTALVNYGEGDWDDTLQPADPAMRERMVSSWTVGLAYHTFRQLAGVCARLADTSRQGRLEGLLARMRRDFADRLMPGAVVAGFLVTEPKGRGRPLLHPSDRASGIRYRLLPMTRAVLAELFTPAEAARHMDIVHAELLYPDGVRLMSEPAAYHGGRENMFKRADTAANVGREIGLQYVHAHLRYAAAMAKLGDAGRLWTALQVINPVGLAHAVPRAVARQSNVYFSSSDADFNDRYEAQRRWPELRDGTVPVRGGWRLYSSGPGIFVHNVRSCLLGLRESFGDIVFDPVLAPELDGLVAEARLCGQPVELHFRTGGRPFAPRGLTINGAPVPGGRREANPYREGGLAFETRLLRPLLSGGGTVIAIEF